MIAGSLAVWSAFTALCGTATGYWQLFLCRLGVGVGEAGGVAPSYALISDYFPPERRARALAIYSLGIPIGLAGGSFLGAFLASSIGLAAHLPAARPCRPRPCADRRFVRDLPSAPAAAAGAAARSLPLLARKPTFWLIAFASSLSSLCGYGLALVVPLRDDAQLPPRPARRPAISSSTLLLIGGSAGVFVGGWLADRLGGMERSWYARVPAIAWMTPCRSTRAGCSRPTCRSPGCCSCIPNALAIVWLGPVTPRFSILRSRPMRATASASFLLINNLIGLGVGPLLIGRISDALKHSYGAESLRNAAVGCTAFYLLAGLLMLVAAPGSHATGSTTNLDFRMLLRLRSGRPAGRALAVSI